MKTPLKKVSGELLAEDCESGTAKRVGESLRATPPADYGSFRPNMDLTIFGAGTFVIGGAVSETGRTGEAEGGVKAWNSQPRPK
jgi:hypothetical protein